MTSLRFHAVTTPAALPACPWWCEDEEHWQEHGSRKHEVGVGAVELPHKGAAERRVTVACHITAQDNFQGDLVVSEPPAAIFIEYGGGLPRCVLRCETPEHAEHLAALVLEAARKLREVLADPAGAPATGG